MQPFENGQIWGKYHSFQKEFLHLSTVDLFTQTFQKSTNCDLPITLGYYDDYNKRHQYLDKKKKKRRKMNFYRNRVKGVT